MKFRNNNFSSRQLLFQELFIGTLIYVTVLGLFQDYTSIVYAKSFSTILFAAVVLELFTYLAFQLKNKIINLLKNREGKIYLVLMFFCVWLVMFLSKFVFIWVLDLIFGEYININGFFGILFVVLSVTVIHRLAYLIFNILGEAESRF